MLSVGLVRFIRESTDNRLLQDMLALVIALTISRGRFSAYSRVIHDVVGGSLYSAYLRIVSSLRNMDRSESYLTQAAAEELGKQGRCKTWIHNGLTHTRSLGNINALVGVRGRLLPRRMHGLVEWEFSPEFKVRLARAFSNYGDRLGSHSAEVLEIVRAGLASVEAPDLPFGEVLAACEGDERKARANWLALEKLRIGGAREARFGLGGRIYHALTNIKKGLRRKFTIRGSPVVEVDKHATFLNIIAAKMAPPGERERLLAICGTGDAYGQIAPLLGMDDGKELKKRFQAEVVFSFRPTWSPIWKAFQREFPGTAAAIADIRDGSEMVVNERVERDSQGVQRTIKTRWGQRRLSRILERWESEIFLHRSLVRLHRDHGIIAVPIHDCLMVPQEHASLTRSVIEQAAYEVLGHTPVIKVG